MMAGDLVFQPAGWRTRVPWHGKLGWLMIIDELSHAECETVLSANDTAKPGMRPRPPPLRRADQLRVLGRLHLQLLARRAEDRLDALQHLRLTPRGRSSLWREVERDALLIGSEIEIAADELRALVDPDGLSIADAEPRIDGRREPGIISTMVSYPDLATGGNLVVDKVHGPGLVDLDGCGAILTQLRLQPAFGGLLRNCSPISLQRR